MDGNKKDHEFVRLFQEYYDKIYNLSMRMCSNDAVAQDITQETFIRIYKNRDSFKGQSSVFSWIYSIAIHCSIDYIRREKSLYGKLGKFFGSKKDESKNFEDVAINRSAGLQILERMSPTNRALMILRLYLDLSYNEIAKVMKMTPASVGVQLTRARQEAQEIAKEVGMSYEV